MLDGLIVLGFVAYAVTVGLRNRRRAARSLDDYFLAGKEVKGWRAGLSMAATQYAADTPLLVTGLVATGGVYLMWHFWIYGFGYLLLAFFFAEGWRRAGVLTDAAFTEVRYGGRGVLALRTLKAVYYGTIVNCFFLAMVLIAAVRIAEVFLPWHEWLPENVYMVLLNAVTTVGWTLGASATALSPEMTATNGLISLVLIIAFVFLYSATGGLRSVISTDVMQFVLMMVGTAAYAVLVLQEVGGFSGLGERLVTVYGAAKSQELMALAPTTTGTLFPFLMLIALQGLFWIGSDGTGYLAQRAMACHTDRDARIAGVVFSWAQILVRSLLWLIIGAGLLVLYPFTPDQATAEGFAAAREMTFVTGIDDLMPIGLRGVLLTALLAALASTVDTHLNWGASYWTTDLYERLYCQAWRKQTPSPRASVGVARLSNLVVVIIALAIMVNLGSIQATWFLSLVFGAGIGGVLMLRWFWERLNLYGEAAALLVSLVVAPFVINMVDEEWIRLAIMVVLGTGSAVLVSYLTPATPTEVQQRFYEQVRPLGWWRKSARQSPAEGPHPVHAFWQRLRVTCFASVSLLLLLIGLAKWMVAAPGESIWWIGVCFVGAVVAVPFWWPALQSKTE